MRVKLARELARALLEVRHRYVRHAPLPAPAEAGRVPYHRRGAAADRVADERAAVGLLARIGEKGRAGRGAAAVGDEPLDHCALGGKTLEGLHGPVTCFLSPGRTRRAG